MRTVTLLKTIPSTSHNAPYSEEHGHHWPAGTVFRVLPATRRKSLLLATADWPEKFCSSR